MLLHVLRPFPLQAELNIRPQLERLAFRGPAPDREPPAWGQPFSFIDFLTVEFITDPSAISLDDRRFVYLARIS